MSSRVCSSHSRFPRVFAEHLVVRVCVFVFLQFHFVFFFVFLLFFFRSLLRVLISFRGFAFHFCRFFFFDIPFFAFASITSYSLPISFLFPYFVTTLLTLRLFSNELVGRGSISTPVPPHAVP